MSEDVGILVFIGGAFLLVVLMILVGAKLASRGRPATGPVRHADVDDDDLGSWRRSSAMDSTPYLAAGAIATMDGDLVSAGEDRDGDGRPDDDRSDSSGDGGWDSSDSSSDSGDSGGGDSSD